MHALVCCNEFVTKQKKKEINYGCEIFCKNEPQSGSEKSTETRQG